MAHRSLLPPRPPLEGEADHDLGEAPSWLPQPLRAPGPDRRLVAVGLLAAIAVGWWLLRPGATPVEDTLPMAQRTTATPADGAGTSPDAPSGAAGTEASATVASTTTEVSPLVVQAAGAVARPGVYRLAPGARVDDLIRRAGGLTPRADRNRINLAAPLADGERIWIAIRGQAGAPDVVAGTGGATSAGSSGSPTSPTGGGAAAGPAGSTSAPAGPVDLNTATQEQLEALPGVGPTTAASILAYRQQSGGFRSVEDLLEVRGIGDAKFEQLRPLVTI